MELINEFRVAVPIDEAWAVLTDLERIAPCMPGAELQDREGDKYRGTVKVKVGPITAQYKGTVAFREKDDTAHRAVLKADGRETRGQGNANALVTAQLSQDGDGTRVVVTTDLTISGKAAQFGRGVLADVSTKLLMQFVDRLETDVLVGVATVDADTTPAPLRASTSANASSGVPPARSAEAAPLNLLGTVAVPVAKRAGPLVAVLLVGYWLLRRRTMNARSR